MTLSNVDVTSFSQVEVNFYFYVRSMENNEDFWLRYYNGSSWTTVATWTRGVDIDNNTFYNATITLDASQYTFAVNSGFRFQNDASGNNDQIFIDQVTITGLGGTSRGSKDSLTALGRFETEDAGFEDEFLVYPNPVKGNMLNIKVSENNNIAYRIINMIGQTIKTGHTPKQINVSNLKAGVYFIEVNDGEEVMTKKFIKE